MEQQTEIWRPVIGYEGLYEASNLGRIRSFYGKKVSILKPRLRTGGQYSCTLHKDAVPKDHSIHRLVWTAFNGPTDLVIDHIIEGDKSNNRLDNLQALTIRQNTIKYMLTTKKTSRYTGVHWCIRAKKWRSTIWIKGKQLFIGHFLNEDDAHLAYQKKVKEIL